VAGAVLAGLRRSVTVAAALVYGAVLWALMGLVWLPYLGSGLFGTAVTVKIAAATLLLHLVYALTLGLLLDRRARIRPAAASA
jgi:ABC-type long-subunit fatty acid transport system fused permease/ATPase subunit